MTACTAQSASSVLTSNHRAVSVSFRHAVRERPREPAQARLRGHRESSSVRIADKPGLCGMQLTA